ncbi:MAG: FAD-dependent oxidoreductase [Candidatus Hydrogenedentes bacterium]|nr:FAD-dependent oxidoreductase [Candidatus Hydrogenedentota bacterium]
MAEAANSGRITRRAAIKGMAVGALAGGAAMNRVEFVSAEENRNVDVIVVGAGAAGCMAATNLVDVGKSVVVVEANPRVGGRLKRGEIAGQAIDLGGQWVGPSQTRALEVSRQLDIATYPTYTKGATLIDVAGKTYRGFSLSNEALTEYLKLAARIDELADAIPLDAPWNAPQADAWDATTMTTWIRETAKTQEVREIMRVIVEVVCSVDPSQISLLQFLWYFKSGNGFNDITGTQGGAQQDLFKGGFVSLPEKLAKALGDRVVLDAPVRAIVQDDHQITAITDKGEWTAKRLVMTAPPSIAARIDYSPTLPYKRRGLMERMPMGAVIKCFVAYEKPFWRDDKLNGQSISASAAFGSTFDITAPGNPHGILCGFFDGGPAMRWADKSPEERRARVIEDIAHAFGDAARSPIDYVEQNWPGEPWSIGGYTSIPGPGTVTIFGDAIRTPCGRIHWAGTETSDVWSGYVEGALRSGDRVAAEVLDMLKSS